MVIVAAVIVCVYLWALCCWAVSLVWFEVLVVPKVGGGNRQKGKGGKGNFGWMPGLVEEKQQANHHAPQCDTRLSNIQPESLSHRLVNRLGDRIREITYFFFCRASSYKAPSTHSSSFYQKKCIPSIGPKFKKHDLLTSTPDMRISQVNCSFLNPSSCSSFTTGRCEFSKGHT